MPNIKVSELSNLSNPSTTGTYLYGVDFTGETNVSRKITLDEALYSKVPTAAELSESGALQAYINAELDRDNFSGDIILPRGVIYLDAPITIGPRGGGSGLGVSGVTIRGAGAVVRSGTTKIGTGYQLFGYHAFGTLIVYTGDKTQAAITIQHGKYITFTDFSLHKATPESRTFIPGADDYGISGFDCEGGANWGCNFVRFERVDTRGFTYGIACGRVGGSVNPGADITLRDCVFSNCSYGFYANKLQGVIYNLAGCYFYGSGTQIAIFLDKEVPSNGSGSGNLWCFGCASNGIITFIRDDAGGNNNATVGVWGLKMDVGSGTTYIPTVYDGSRLINRRAVTLTNINITEGAGSRDLRMTQDLTTDPPQDAPNPHRFFKISTNSLYDGDYPSVGTETDSSFRSWLTLKDIALRHFTEYTGVADPVDTGLDPKHNSPLAIGVYHPTSGTWLGDILPSDDLIAQHSITSVFEGKPNPIS